jgi:hypothetical protein
MRRSRVPATSTTPLVLLTGVLLAGCWAASCAPAAADTPVPTATGTAPAVGSSFLTAVALVPGQPATASGSTGDYLYWSVPALAGDTSTVTATVQLPPSAGRHGPAQWRLDVFDGLRRAQPCTAGDPKRTAAVADGSIRLSCTLPTIRSWAEGWSNAPLPGTYDVRLSLAQTAETDLGQPFAVQAQADRTAGEAQPEGGSLQPPLVMPGTGGALPPSASASASADGGQGVVASPPVVAPSPSATTPGVTQRAEGLFSGTNGRWWWTGADAGVAAVAGIAGFTLTRHPRRWLSRAR